MKRVITIDGPCGAGKSTVARLVAEKLGFNYLDTGALYRAVALYLKRKGLSDSSPDEELSNALRGLEISFRNGAVFINREDVSTLIRTPEVGHYASVFSARRPVRDFLLIPQRIFAEEYDTVAEGRDMGTVVFPQAWRKFFLDASVKERAKRRYEQLIQMGKDITLEEAFRDIQDRDKRDSQRAIAPLRKPEDAVYIDTTNLSIEETVQRIIDAL
jgi:cytidylate kinase